MYCILQGAFIFLCFNLKLKIYYQAYEKIMGRPHPAVRLKKLNRLGSAPNDQANFGKIQAVIGCWKCFKDDELDLRKVKFELIVNYNYKF